MKKIDLYLVALYLLFVVIIGGVAWRNSYRDYRTRMDMRQSLKELYRHPVRAVVIEDTDIYLSVNYGDTKGNGFYLQGVLDFTFLDHIAVVSDTLRIFGADVLFVTLWLPEGVEVQVKNAPHVKFQDTLFPLIPDTVSHGEAADTLALKPAASATVPESVAPATAPNRTEGGSHGI